MVETELLLQLLVRLLANPLRLDGAGQDLQRRVGGQVGEIVFALAGQMLASHVTDTLGRAVGHADAERCEAGGEPSLRAAPPTDRSPRPLGEKLLRGEGLAIRDMTLARSTVPRDREDQRDIGRVHLLPTWDADVQVRSR